MQNVDALKCLHLLLASRFEPIGPNWFTRIKDTYLHKFSTWRDETALNGMCDLFVNAIEHLPSMKKLSNKIGTI